MKKIYLTLIVTAALVLTSCGAKSEASREQISKGHEQAQEMLDHIKEEGKAPTATQVREAASTATTPAAEIGAAPDTLTGK